VSPWLILLLVIYPVTEWFAASWLAGSIGWGGVLLVVAALFLVGVAVMRRAGFAAARSLRPVQVDGATVLPNVTQDALSRAGQEVGDAGTLFFAGLLIAVPGLVTSALGLLLLLPPVRRLVRRRVSRSVRRRAGVSGFVVETTTTTVQGTVVRDDGPQDDGPQDRPQIISGEIVRDEHPDD
jgi:UPF0716 protein FxsA